MDLYFAIYVKLYNIRNVYEQELNITKIVLRYIQYELPTNAQDTYIQVFEKH